MHESSIVSRIESTIGVPGLADRLAELAGSDLTSLLLAVAHRRASGVDPPTVLEQHRTDRFARRSSIPQRDLHRVAATALRSLPPGFETVQLAPLAPFGLHAVLGGTSQNNLVTTVRRTEVAGDPTAGLALEAAVQRMHDRHRVVRLATTQRVVRAQRFEGSRSFAHFSLFGVVTAGRDPGHRRFESDALAEHVSITTQICLALGLDRVRVALTDFSGDMTGVVGRLESHRWSNDVEITIDRDRTRAEGYYPSLCFAVSALAGGEWREYGDGGLVDWGRRLLSDRKERMMISGLSIDRLAMDTAPS